MIQISAGLYTLLSNYLVLKRQGIIFTPSNACAKFLRLEVFAKYFVIRFRRSAAVVYDLSIWSVRKIALPPDSNFCANALNRFYKNIVLPFFDLKFESDLFRQHEKTHQQRPSLLLLYR